jgi:hypothetical protein
MMLGEISYKYNLVDRLTGEIVFKGNDNTQVFGGMWGALDLDGNPLFVWQENTPDPVEVKAAAIAELNAGFVADKSQLAGYMLSALMDNDVLTQEDIQSEYAALLSEYQGKLAALKNG